MPVYCTNKFSIIFWLAIFLLLISGISLSYAEVKGDTIYLDLEFSAPEITPSLQSPMYNHIEMKGLYSSGEVGEPVLPVKGLKVLIPQGKKVKTVDITLGEKIILPGFYMIEPGQKQYPIIEMDNVKPEPDKPKPEVYSSDAAYPAQLHKFHAVHKKLGYSIAIINIFPVEYNPSKGKISYYKTISVAVRLEPDTQLKSIRKANTPLRLRTKGKVRDRDKEQIQGFIDNKEDLAIIEQTTAASTQELTLSSEAQTLQLLASSGSITPGQYDYVIITCSDFASGFEPLKQRKIQDGLTATIVTTDWIYANYEGNRPDGGLDNQTKIRNFIIDAYINWGTQYVLLGGDGDGANLGGESQDAIIPVRELSDFFTIRHDIPADLYYACLDGSFDHNANGIYGEVGDGEAGGEVDLLAEVYVGRAPVDSITEVNNFVNKTIAYENATDPYLKTNYMLSEWMGWGGHLEYSTVHMEEIRLGSDADGFTTKGFLSNPDMALDVETLYDDPLYSWPSTDLINIMNNGVHILNHCGHSAIFSNMKLGSWLVDALSNDKYFIIYSQGCDAAAFDNFYKSSGSYISEDCIAEHFTTNLTGAVAYIGNSRSGWSEASQLFNRQFWDALFNENITKLGMLNQDSKEDNLPFLSGHLIRYCYFGLNLLGDPALSVHTPNDLILQISNYSLGSIFLESSWEFIVNLKALNQDALNVSVSLSSGDPNIIIERGDIGFGTILKGESKINSDAPFLVKVPSEPYSGRVKLILAITANGYSKEREIWTYFDNIPATGSVNINNGEDFAYWSNVTLNLSASDTGSGMGYGAKMQFSNDNITWSEPEEYNTTKVWTLTAGYGTKTVYVKFRDVAGNWSEAFSDTVTVIADTFPPQGFILINFGNDFTLGSGVFLFLSASDAESGMGTGSQMQFSNDNITWSTPEAYFDPVVKDWTLSPGYGIKTVYVKFRDVAGNWSDAYSDTITVIDLSPPYGLVIINEGDYYVYNNNPDSGTNVNLFLFANDAESGMGYGAKMQFSNDNITWSEPEDYNTAKVWTLTAGYGTKTVYVKFMNAAGNWSEAFSDTVTVIADTFPPRGSILINGGSSYTNSGSVSLSLTAVDKETGVAQMQFSNDNVTWSDPEPYASTKDWLLSIFAGNKTVYVRFADNAGNWSQSCSASIFLDVTPPFGWLSINNGAQYTTSASINLVITAIDQKGSGVGPNCPMQITNDNTNWSAPIPFAYNNPWTLSPGDGTKTVYVRFADNAGNWSQTYSSSIILDTTAPTRPFIISAIATKEKRFDRIAALWISRDNLSGIAEYQYRLTENSPSGPVIRDWTSTGTKNSVVISDLRLKHNRIYYLSVKAKNGAGLWSNIGYSRGIREKIKFPKHR